MSSPIRASDGLPRGGCGGGAGQCGCRAGSLRLRATTRSQSEPAARRRPAYRRTSAQAEEHVSPPDSQQGRLPVGDPGLEEVVHESIPHDCHPAAGRSRLPVGGPSGSLPQKDPEIS